MSWRHWPPDLTSRSSPHPTPTPTEMRYHRTGRRAWMSKTRRRRLWVGEKKNLPSFFSRALDEEWPRVPLLPSWSHACGGRGLDMSPEQFREPLSIRSSQTNPDPRERGTLPVSAWETLFRMWRAFAFVLACVLSFARLSEVKWRVLHITRLIITISRLFSDTPNNYPKNSASATYIYP